MLNAPQMATSFITTTGKAISLAEADISWIEDQPDGTVTICTRDWEKHSLPGNTLSVYARFCNPQNPH